MGQIILFPKGPLVLILGQGVKQAVDTQKDHRAYQDIKGDHPGGDQ